VQKLVDDVAKRFGSVDLLINDAAYNKAIAFSDLDGMTLRGVDQDHRHQPHRPDAAVQGGGAGDEEAGATGGSSTSRRSRDWGPTGSSIAYAVSKAGLIHLTKCMAVAMAPEVLVNCVAPGLLEGTRATANLFPGSSRRARPDALGTAADKDDCADQVVTMCRTNTMTGQTIVIDAGKTFH